MRYSHRQESRIQRDALRSAATVKQEVEALSKELGTPQFKSIDIDSHNVYNELIKIRMDIQMLNVYMSILIVFMAGSILYFLLGVADSAGERE
jgi:hypothetical protein